MDTYIMLTSAFVASLLFFTTKEQSLAYNVLFLLVSADLLYAALHDIKTRSIPNTSVLILLLLYVARLLIDASQHKVNRNIPADILSALFVTILLFGADFLLQKINAMPKQLKIIRPTNVSRAGPNSQQHHVGGGDIKLLFACTLYIGSPHALSFIMIASLLGLMWALCYRGPYPWAPGIALATWLVLLCLG